MTLEIVYQDDALVAINKPPGLLVHRSPIDRHETEFAVQMLRDQIGRYVYPVHRLDRPTSGVLVFAYDSQMAGLMGQQLMQKQCQKRYLAIVRGWVKHTGLMDYALPYRLDKYADKDRRPQQDSQTAVTGYQGLRWFDIPFSSGRYASSRFSLVSLSPSTGRKHQLRRHMAHFRHPIIGDTTHGDGKQNKFLRDRFNFSNLALSCTGMGFYHPVTGRWLSISSPVHSAMATLLEQWQPYECDAGKP
ncbi:pseudouridine synthase [Alteromonas sp. CYL-A6]|uniref:pseudouridine synthase n=1 Tax=Alteromonas nitratireducens TaxID=3390813 RepID=UPI0034AAA3FF